MNNICYFLVSTEKNFDRKKKLTETWLNGKNYLFFSDKENLYFIRLFFKNCFNAIVGTIE